MFKKVLGQEGAKKFFQSVLKEDKLSHAYILTGPAGVGKFLFARELAAVLLCEKQSGCGQCRNCLRVTHGNHPSIRLFETPKGKKNIGIDMVRDLEHEIRLKPFEGKYKIFIINDTETLSEEAANALLKTLEEPPDYSLLLLVAAQTGSLPTTVLSRCQIVRFQPLPEKIVGEILAKHQKLSAAELKILVTLAGGSPGQALRLYEKGFTEQRHQLIQGLLSTRLNGRSGGQEKSGMIDDIIHFAKRAKENEEIRADVAQQFKIISLFLRDLLLMKSGITAAERLFNADKRDLLQKAKSVFPVDRLNRALEQLLQAEQYLHQNLNIRLVVANTVLNL